MVKTKTLFTKLFYSEHWPSYFYYVPLIPYYLYKSILAKSLTFFLAVNPAIKYSGMGSESKFKTLGLLPDIYTPKSILISPEFDFNSILKLLIESKIDFPLIAKPDIGFRGLLVQKIDNQTDLRTYLSSNTIHIILQEYVDYPKECGMFYYKIPGETNGHITSVTLKKFMSVTGNGIDNLGHLIRNDKKAFLYYKIFYELHYKKINDIPKNGESVKLTVIGNHSKGTIFINGNHLIDDQLVKFLDKITASIPDFYYGRFDIKFDNLKKLKAGNSFKILELNGIIAEPTHIYDTKNSNYLAALYCIWQHWSIITKIARKNHNKFNVPYPKLRPFLKEMLWLRTYSGILKKRKNLNENSP